MNFYSMAVNNIKRKSETYFTYFLSTTFAVAIFYIFCTIYYNPEFADFHTGISKIGIVFQFSAVIVLGFSSIFVFYANSLFIRSRKKEIAIFSLLGMRKREIGLLLFTETLIVGVCSAACGILLGSLFSRFFSMILVKLMLGGAPGNHMSFRLTWQPVVISFGVFLLLFVLNAFYSMRIIYKSKLIDLLSAAKEGEKAPEFSWISSGLSFAMILSAYVILLNFNGNEGAIRLIKPVILAGVLLVAGTYLLFQNVIILIFSKCKNNNTFYLKTGNFISISQLIYRIKANANMFCVIALMSAFTITLMSGVISFYISLNSSMTIYAPYSYLCRNIDASVKKQVLHAVQQDKSVQLYAVTDIDVLTTKASLEGYKVDTNSEYGKITTSVGEKFDLDIIRFSDYQKVIRDTKAKESNGNKGAIYVSTLKKGDCLFLDGNYGHDYSDRIDGKNIHVVTDSGEKDFHITGVSLFKYMGAAHARTTLVIPDEDARTDFADQGRYQVNHCFGLKLGNPLEAGALYDKLNTIVSAGNRDMSYLEYHQLLFNMYGAYIFIGIFLGILFLLAAGSIIFYKQLMEARDDEGRYEILRKIGMSKKEVEASVHRQIAAAFLLPSAVALIHSVVILITYQHMVYTIAVDSPILWYVFAVVMIYFLIYAMFYLLSVRGYLSVVWKEN